MFRILLVDDEGIMLESLKKIITTSFESECNIRRIKTGRDVMEMTESFHPDITFVDIHMPGLNGIQAIREIRKVDKEMMITIVTAYDKLAYAKEAVDPGVMEYLTKPTSNKKITLDVCMKAMQRAEEAGQKGSDDLKIKERLEIMVSTVESGFIYNMLQGDDADSSGYEELLRTREYYGFRLVLEFGDGSESGRLTSVTGSSVKASRYYQTVRRIVEDYFSCIAGSAMGSRVVLFVPSPEPVLKHEERVEIITRTRTMLQRLEEHVDSDFRSDIGSTRTLGNAEESYGETPRVLRENVSHVAHITDVPSGQENVAEEYPKELENSYCERGLKADSERAAAHGAKLFSCIQRRYDYRKDLEAKVLELIMQLEHRIYTKDDTEFGLRPRGSYIQEIKEASDNDKLCRRFLERTWEICQCTGTERKRRMEYLVDTMRKYIDENYQKDIPLDEISRIVNISPYYFSRLFKQGTGENFIEYLTRTKIRQACVCPRDPDYSIKQICAVVGYSDLSYFNRIFKRYEGVNPSKYRERMESGAGKVQGRVQDWLGKGQRNHMGIRKKRTADSIVCMLFTAPFSVLAISGCAKTEDAAAGSVGQEEQEVQIGLSSESSVVERWTRKRDVFVSVTKELEAEVNVQNANGDAEGQISQIGYFVKEQVGVIVIVTGDCEALSDVMTKARGAGIRTISYGRLTMSAGCDSYISFSNTEVGKLMAESILENIPDGGDTFLIQGPLTDNNASLTREGIDEALVGSNFNVVHEANCPGWIAENAYTYTKEGLKLDRNAKEIIRGNDDLVDQAFRALSEERLAGKVCVTGQDGDLAACQCIVEETQEMTAFKSVEQEADLVAKCTVLLRLGGEIERTQDTVYDGTYNASYLELQPIAVIKENMDEAIIKSRFHAKEDVCLNVN